MSKVGDIVASIRAAAERRGLAEFSRQSGVPYTTLIDWQKRNWIPRSVEALERLAEAADLPETANDTSPSSEAA